MNRTGSGTSVKLPRFRPSESRTNAMTGFLRNSTEPTNTVVASQSSGMDFFKICAELAARFSEVVSMRPGMLPFLFFLALVMAVFSSSSSLSTLNRT